MKKRSLSIDFGPIALAFADHFVDNAHGCEGLMPASRKDAERLQHLVNDYRGASTDGRGLQGIDSDVSVNSDLSAVFKRSQSADIMQALKLAFSVATTSRQIATSVALKLNPELLPNSHLVIEKNSEEISFDLYVAERSVVNSLVKTLDAMTQELGELLGCSIKLRLFDVEQDCLCRSSVWRWEQRR